MPSSSITVYLNCSKCAARQMFTVDNVSESVLVSRADNAPIAFTCPGCCSANTLPKKVIACVSCRQSFSVADLLLGSPGECPHCNESLHFPTAAELAPLNNDRGRCRWIVFHGDQTNPVRLSGRDELVAAISEPRLLGTDPCMIHQFAPPTTLKEACDQVFAVRKLYDPKGAYKLRLDGIAGSVAFVCGAICAMFLVLTVDPLFSWRGGTPERTIIKLIAAGVLILVGFAIGAVPVVLIGGMLNSIILDRIKFRPPKLHWP